MKLQIDYNNLGQLLEVQSCMPIPKGPRREIHMDIARSPSLFFSQPPMALSYVCLNCRLSSRWSRLSRPVRSFSSTRTNLDALRPATAPKPTPDVKHIRQNAELYAKNCVDRNYAAHAGYPLQIQQLSEEAKQLDHDLKTPRSHIKQIEKTIAKLQIATRQDPNGSKNEQSQTPSEELASLKSEAQRLKDNSAAMTDRKATCTEEINRLALSLPNLSSPHTPIGHIPKLVSYINFNPSNPPPWTQQSQSDLQARSHVTIGTNLRLLDFASSATTTGWGWYFLINEGAMLEQALIQYALSVARRRAWRTVAPPSIVYSYIAEACGFQPRDQHNEQQIWNIEQSDRDRNKPSRSLTGTAEIPLAAMYAGRDIPATDLPIKLVGASRCYRAEAGSRGVDTKGLYRVHEFTKVELFGWTDNVEAEANTESNPKPTSDDMFAELLEIQTEILTSLNLPCRILEMPTGDLGASATRKRDIEALFPSRLRPSPATSTATAGDVVDPSIHELESAWGEVTSASICTDYQSRRLAARVRAGKESRFPHTVNGTAMAVPRVLAAILENGWDAQRGVVVVPEVLRPWMDGMEFIGKEVE
jgi:seryl-tRNA synthetase